MGASLTDVQPLLSPDQGYREVAKLSIFVGALVVGALVWVLTPLSELAQADRLESLVRSVGFWGPLLFIALYIGRTFFPLFLPSLLTVIGGIIFGPIEGFVYVLISTMGSAWLGFVAARRMGRGFVSRVIGRSQGSLVARMDSFLHRGGFWPVVVLRVIPGTPFDAISYMGGLSGMPMRTWLAGNLVGLAPVVAVWVLLGSSLRQIGSLTFWLAVGGLVALAVVGLALSRTRLAAPLPSLSGDGGDAEE